MKESTKRRGFLKAAGLIATGAALAEALASREAKANHGNDRDDFIRTVKRARIFDLSHVWDENSPIAGVNPPYAMELAATHADTLGTFGDGGKLSFTSEIQQWSGQHGAPSIDAIGHIGRNGKLFGGVDAAKATSDLRGLGRSGVGAHLDIAHYPKEHAGEPGGAARRGALHQPQQARGAAGRVRHHRRHARTTRRATRACGSIAATRCSSAPDGESTSRGTPTSTRATPPRASA